MASSNKTSCTQNKRQSPCTPHLGPSKGTGAMPPQRGQAVPCGCPSGRQTGRLTRWLAVGAGRCSAGVGQQAAAALRSRRSIASLISSDMHKTVYAMAWRHMLPAPGAAAAVRASGGRAAGGDRVRGGGACEAIVSCTQPAHRPALAAGLTARRRAKRERKAAAGPGAAPDYRPCVRGCPWITPRAPGEDARAPCKATSAGGLLCLKPIAVTRPQTDPRL